MTIRKFVVWVFIIAALLLIAVVLMPKLEAQENLLNEISPKPISVKYFYAPPAKTSQTMEESMVGIRVMEL